MQISSRYSKASFAPRAEKSKHGNENYQTDDGMFNDFPGRDGYDPNFLGVTLPMPTLSKELRAKAAPLLADPSQIELKYTHFSVIQHAQRATPMLTAVNIDGAQFHDLERDGTWVMDGRIAPEFQTNNSAYRKNDIDRGHMVRRKDAMWGSEADLAGNDTFVYTNAALQHADLNQKPWLDVENSVLYGAIAKKEKKTVFTGPIFQDNDPKFDNHGMMKRATQIPTAFWKVEVWNEPSKGLQAEAFVLSQKDFINKPASREHYQPMTPMKMQTYRVSIDQLEKMTDLDFGDLHDGADRTASDAKAMNEAGINPREHSWDKEKKGKHGSQAA